MPSKGGSGSASAPQLSIPTNLYEDLSQLENFAAQGGGYLGNLGNMTNWASGGATTGYSGGGNPQLSTAWNQIQGLATNANLSQDTTNALWQQEALQGQQAQQYSGLGSALLRTGGQTFAQGEGILSGGQQMLGEAEQMLNTATSGSGLYSSQQAYVQQGVQSEQAQLEQQLASQGMGASTAAAILSGEAQQQGAATAGQLVQGNIQAAQQEQALAQQQMGLGQTQIGLGQTQIGLSQQEQNLALNTQNLQQGTMKLIQGEQALTDSENQAVAQLSMAFQGDMWNQAMSGSGAMAQMMSTIGNLYGVDVQGYLGIMNAENQNNQIQAQISEANAGLASSAASSLGAGLGSILGGSGSGGGILGGGGGLLGSIGSGAGSGVAASGSGILGGVSSGLGSILGSSAGLGGVVTDLIGLISLF